MIYYTIPYYTILFYCMILYDILGPSRGRRRGWWRRSAAAPTGTQRKGCSQERSALCDMFRSSAKTLLVKCPSVQWQPDGFTIRTQKWLLGAGFLGAPRIFFSRPGRPQILRYTYISTAHLYLYTHILLYTF